MTDISKKPLSTDFCSSEASSQPKNTVPSQLRREDSEFKNTGNQRCAAPTDLDEISDLENAPRSSLEKDAASERKSSDSEPDSSHVTPYTIFDRMDRFILIFVLALGGFWSTMSSPIYFPALPTLTRYFDTTPAITNLSLVAYLFFQGLAPFVIANTADFFGLRPVVVIAIISYVAVCIGLSQTNAFWLLVVLRCLQAISIAPVIAIGSGVSGSVCTPANRGSFVGAVSGIQLMGNGFGGLIGAALIHGFNTWRLIFVFLAVGAGVSFIVALIFLPETNRAIVGNGSVVPKLWIHRLLLLQLPHIKAKLTNDYETIRPRQKFDFFAPLRILVQLRVLCILIPAGIAFASWTMLLASLSLVLESLLYNYSVMKVGWVYLPQGVSCFVGSLLNGRVLNKYYNRRMRLHTEKHANVENPPPFNVARARLDIMVVPIALEVIGLIIFGWCIDYKKSVASIIVSSMLVSFSTVCIMGCSTCLMVDLTPGKGSSATSCLNLVRCWLAALGTGVLDNMISAMTLGGCYTFLAGIFLLSTSLTLVTFKLNAKNER